MEKVSSNLKLWCLGFGINPSIIDRADIQEYISRGDGVAVHEVIYRHAEAQEGMQMNRPNRSNHLLECSAIVNDDDEALLIAALLGGEKLR